MKPRHYILIFLSLIFSVVSLFISLHFFIEGATFSFKLADLYLKLLIAIAGVIVGFSILTLYSIVNANFDSLKKEIETELGKLREVDEKTKNAQKSGEDNDKNTLYLFVLTSEHTPDYYKSSAIQHFITSLEKDKNCINENMKGTIRKYYASLKGEKEKPSDLSYLKNLVELLGE